MKTSDFGLQRNVNFAPVNESHMFVCKGIRPHQFYRQKLSMQLLKQCHWYSKVYLQDLLIKEIVSGDRLNAIIIHVFQTTKEETLRQQKMLIMFGIKMSIHFDKMADFDDSDCWCWYHKNEGPRGYFLRKYQLNGYFYYTGMIIFHPQMTIKVEKLFCGLQKWTQLFQMVSVLKIACL